MLKLRFSVFLCCALALAGDSIVIADIDPQLIVDHFAGVGVSEWWFTGNGSDAYETVLQRSNASGTVPNLSAYSSRTTVSQGQGATGLYSFSLNPGAGTGSQGYAVLNYDASTGTTNSLSGSALTVGAAWLYAQYAQAESGAFHGIFRYDASASTRREDAGLLRDAINLLLTANDVSEIRNAAYGNKFLAAMLDVRDADYWMRTYNVVQGDATIGDLAVFVMNLTYTNGSGGTQDFLFVAEARYQGINAVPEPASLLLWSFGAIGAFGFGCRRKRRIIALA